MEIAKKQKEALNRKQEESSKYVDGKLQKILGKLRSSVDFEHFLLKIKLKNHEP